MYVYRVSYYIALPLTPMYVATSNENNGLVHITKWWNWPNIKEEAVHMSLLLMSAHNTQNISILLATFWYQSLL